MFFQNNLLSEVCDLISNYWKPKKQYSREIQYRDDLMDFLYRNLNQPQTTFYFYTFPRSVSVKKEAGRGLCDIAVGGKQIGIELKKDLDSKSKVDRLLGQVDRYLDEYQYVFIVLVGYTTQSTYSDLKERISAKQMIYSPRIFIVRRAILRTNKIKSTMQAKIKRKSKRRRRG